MELVIKIQNGKPIDHPILLENFKQAYPNIDTNNLPSDFAWFQRVSKPKMGPYVKNLTSSYEFDGNIVKDIWLIEEMSLEEKVNLQNKVKAEWENTGHNSWIFNEITCSFDPPIPYPTDGKKYEWNEAMLNWQEI